jgi:hypothetical protein
MFDLLSFSENKREGVKQPLTSRARIQNSEFRIQEPGARSQEPGARSQESGAGGICGPKFPRLSSIARNMAQRANRTQAGSLAGIWTFAGGHVGEFSPRRSYVQTPGTFQSRMMRQITSSFCAQTINQQIVSKNLIFQLR